jgi:hypothetical protein
MGSKFFVGMYHGTFASEDQAIAAGKPPSGSASCEEAHTVDGSKLLAFKSPRGDVLILERTAAGTVDLWMSATDLARSTQREADDDVENFQEIGVNGGPFRVFECK